jgi:hypothetical protein
VFRRRYKLIFVGAVLWLATGTSQSAEVPPTNPPVAETFRTRSRITASRANVSQCDICPYAGFHFFPNVKKQIVEQLIKLPVSRQRKWQLRQTQKGLCQKCSKPAVPESVYCLGHMVAQRVAARRRYEPKRGRTHQYRKTKSYRLAAAAQGDLRQLRSSDVQELLNSRWLEHREMAMRALIERPDLRPYARWAA